MKSSIESNYYYKAATIEAIDDIERKKYELTNEYGYNFDSNSRKVINRDNLLIRPANIVNKALISRKR